MALKVRIYDRKYACCQEYHLKIEPATLPVRPTLLTNCRPHLAPFGRPSAATCNAHGTSCQP